jgi:hypothetical protein
LSTDTAVLNVHARLCNSNPVKEALTAVLKDVERVLGVEIKENGPAKKKRLRAKDYASSEDGDRTPAEESAFEGFSGDAGDAGAATGDVSDTEDELQRFNDRLASSESEDEEGDEDEDLDVEAIEQRLEAEGLTRKPQRPAKQSYDHAADLEISEEEELSKSESPEPRKAPILKKSSFVPSLSMGGYISGSGSDIEDIDEKPRKNRRGQRARQQIWEKKYGTKAKHMEKQDKNAGWDPKRGATDSSARHGKSKHNSARGVSGRDGHREPRNGVPATNGAKPGKVDDNKPMHPSWEAAKKAKEKGTAAVAFAGKRISFD